MKHFAAIGCCLLFGFFTKDLRAQSNITNDYVITSTADIVLTTPYTDALDAADWESYRLQNQRYALAFDNGFSIELKSAVELLNAGYPMNLNNYQTALPAGYIPPTLVLQSGNKIGMQIHTTPPKTAEQ